MNSKKELIMFYEGSEKRLAITCTLNLLQFDDLFWQEMVKRAGADIISHIENGELKAFLLSESSLFVWKNRLLLITCGETQLLQAALYFQQKVAPERLTSMLFQRHQATYPARQKTTFQEDSQQLQQQLKGSCRHWNQDYCGDIFLYGNHDAPMGTKNILMMHGLRGHFFQQLQLGEVHQQKVAEQLKLDRFFHNFDIDQHCFEPKGYSLNAIYGAHYFTVHISPEKNSSYLSVESSLDSDEIQAFQEHLMALFDAQQCYLMTFSLQQAQLQIRTQQLHHNVTLSPA